MFAWGQLGLDSFFHSLNEIIHCKLRFALTSIYLMKCTMKLNCDKKVKEEIHKGIHKFQIISVISGKKCEKIWKV